MNLYYLDASAWVKNYHTESGSHWVKHFVEHETEITSAVLGYIEVMTTLSRKRKAGDISDSEYSRILKKLHGDWHRMGKIQLIKEISEIAIQVSEQYALRGADTAHLACALFLKESFESEHQVIFISADKELNAAAQQAGLSVVDPTQQSIIHPHTE